LYGYAQFFQGKFRPEILTGSPPPTHTLEWSGSVEQARDEEQSIFQLQASIAQTVGNTSKVELTTND